jgi:hypothetical protein
VITIHAAPIVDTPTMAILFPSERITQHWQGALQASLDRAPLETFLRSRNIKVARRGAARDSDNICRATLYTLRPPIAWVGSSSSGTQLRFARQVICAVSDALANLIQAPAASRVAALVGTAKLLSRRPEFLAVGDFAGGSARNHPKGPQDPEIDLGRLGALAAEAVIANSELLVRQVRDHVLALLARADQPARITTLRGAAASGAL